jgi:hypothetical protein
MDINIQIKKERKTYKKFGPRIFQCIQISFLDCGECQTHFPLSVQLVKTNFTQKKLIQTIFQIDQILQQVK